ncbi:MAG: acetyltransferase [Treponema sp.]|nr:acetyltransferase [Treponema sp.]
MQNRKTVIIIGAGDHAKVLLDILLDQGYKVLGLVDKNVSKGTVIYGISVLGNDDEILNYKPTEIKLVNGIGSIGNLNLRAKIYKSFKERGYFFETVIHKSAIISKRSVINEGVQILPGTVINTEAHIGENTIINSNVTIEHGCNIERDVHIAPGCTLSGCVKVGEKTHIGTGSSIIQGITIGKSVLVGAGSVVVRDIEDNKKVYGVPAKSYE